MMHLDHLQLAALAAVVDEGSFDKAATVLQVTPSAISQRIKALESAAGRPLLLRTKPTRITEGGARYLRLARQIHSLTHDALVDSDQMSVTVPVAVNSDSLATWVLPALSVLPSHITFDLRREDQDHSADLLRDGSVMAAISTDAVPVAGCEVTRLGVMRYRAFSTPGFAERWFPDGLTEETLGKAPVVVFDRKDDLQDRFIRARSTTTLQPPRHFVPGSADFADAVRLGLGWGMLPAQQTPTDQADGILVDLDPGRHIDVTLFWQHWGIHPPVLDLVSEAVRAAASRFLS